MSEYDDAVEKLMAEYQQQLEKLGEHQRKMSELTGTGVSQRKQVSVTVGAQGQLMELKFLTDSYRDMAPAELSNLIIDTFAAARNELIKQQRELMAANAPAGLNVDALFGPDADLTKAVPRNPFMSDELREYVDNGRIPGVSDD
ncbi:YbaB/EbfC family nucleoid-associated protein [Kutzneria kofuensis]|uniref:DNA-binding protein YbaB n=1 Tax=Kutzneria kofuensis TaxID=103725 RepID=A0A7W9KMR5_9PSEU|nr:YbaB/EbfC family nucleoid-associated protein [Kutzneria kofuensis]MBB5895412.1 DNA-binding protein YbaB [Kutzneria kofuensis]